MITNPSSNIYVALSLRCIRGLLSQLEKQTKGETKLVVKRQFRQQLGLTVKCALAASENLFMDKMLENLARDCFTEKGCSTMRVGFKIRKKKLVSVRMTSYMLQKV